MHDVSQTKVEILSPKLLAMPKIRGFQRFFRLRWMYSLSGRKESVYGQWNGSVKPGSAPSEFGAGRLNKYGLSYAAIQGELANSTLHTLFECDGHDYVMAQWIMAASSAAFFKNKNFTSYKAPADVIGLAFLTRQEKVTAYVNGIVTRRPLTEEEKKFKKKEHSI